MTTQVFTYLCSLPHYSNKRHSAIWLAAWCFFGASDTRPLLTWAELSLGTRLDNTHHEKFIHSRTLSIHGTAQCMFNGVLERLIAGSSYKICFNYCFHGSSIVYHFLPARNQTQRLCKDCEGWRLGHDLVTWPPVRGLGFDSWQLFTFALFCLTLLNTIVRFLCICWSSRYEIEPGTSTMLVSCYVMQDSCSNLIRYLNWKTKNAGVTKLTFLTNLTTKLFLYRYKPASHCHGYSWSRICVVFVRQSTCTCLVPD